MNLNSIHRAVCDGTRLKLLDECDRNDDDCVDNAVFERVEVINEKAVLFLFSFSSGRNLKKSQEQLVQLQRKAKKVQFLDNSRSTIIKYKMNVTFVYTEFQIIQA